MAAADAKVDQDQFPCKLTIDIPFPTARLAKIALRALQVDAELSPLVTRSYALRKSKTDRTADTNGSLNDNAPLKQDDQSHQEDETLNTLEVQYAATTNRMLRVAVNGFFESLRLVVECMEDLDVDVAMQPSEKTLQAVQGLAEVKWNDGAV